MEIKELGNEPKQIDISISQDQKNFVNEPYIRDLFSNLKTNDTIPTHIPKKFIDCFYLYKNGSTYRLYIYMGNTWQEFYGYESPLTTKGDLFVYGSEDTRLAVGTNGQALLADSSQSSGLKWGSPSVDNVAIQITAGESIDGSTTPVGVFIADDETNTGSLQNLEENAFVNDLDSGKFYGQTFTTPQNPYTDIEIDSVKFRLKKTTPATGDLVVKLYATSTGFPTGSVLDSDTLDVSTLSDSDFNIIEFDINYALDANTKYALVLDGSGMTAGDVLVSYENSDVFSGGDAIVSATAGSSWGLFYNVSTPQDLYFDLSYTYKFGLEGKMYQSDITEEARNKVHGFVNSNIVSNNTGSMIVGGAISGFSSLEAGEFYYIQSDNSVGLTFSSLLVGRAVSDSVIDLSKNTGSGALIGAIVSNNLRNSADTERRFNTSGGAMSYTKFKEFIVPITGFYRVSFDLKGETGSNVKYGRIYRNGVAYGTERTTLSTSYVNYSEDLFFVAGDLCQGYFKAIYSGTNESGYTRNFRIKYDIGEVLINNFTDLISLD